MSGHRYIAYEITDGFQPKVNSVQGGWNFNNIDKVKFVDSLQRNEVTSVETLVASTTRACDKVMPRRKASKRGQVCWWNEEIHQARKKCIEYRRKYTRANIKKKKSRKTAEDQGGKYKDEYKVSKHVLQKLIMESKEHQWTRACKEVDKDVWGKGYKIVTKHLRGTLIR